MNDLSHPPPYLRRLFAVAVWLVGATGVAYGAVRYLWRSQDPFALVNHPWQPHLQHLHVLAAPLAIFALGALWAGHVWPARLSYRAGRGSGTVAWWLAIVVVLTGVLVQVLGHPTGRALVGWIHAGAACSWLLTLLLHRRRRR